MNITLHLTCFRRTYYRKFMKFFKVLPKEKWILKCICKRYILQQSWKRLQHFCFQVNIPKVLETAFFRTILLAAFELSFGIKKECSRKKVSGEIAFALINLFQVQIQEPASRSICLSCKICWILLSHNIWNEKSMMT